MCGGGGSSFGSAQQNGETGMVSSSGREGERTGS